VLQVAGALRAGALRAYETFRAALHADLVAPVDAAADEVDRTQLAEKLAAWATTPYVGTSRKGSWKCLRRMRVGADRIVFEVRETTLIVLVVGIGHRGRV